MRWRRSTGTHEARESHPAGGLPRLVQRPPLKKSRVSALRCGAEGRGWRDGKRHITRALAALDQQTPDIASTPPRRISKKITAAIDAMVSGDTKTIKEAAEKVGLAWERLSRALSKPHVAELMRTCARYKIVTRTLGRWLENEALAFPRPVVINGRRYFPRKETRAVGEAPRHPLSRADGLTLPRNQCAS